MWPCESADRSRDSPSASRAGEEGGVRSACTKGRGGAAMYEVWKQTVSHMQRTVQAVTSLCSRRSVVGERDRPSTCDSQRNFEFLRPLKSQNSLCNCHTLALEAP